MIRRRSGTGVPTSRGMWPVLFLLLIAVVVPTACVLWFMGEAVRNVRLAVRQKLADVYRPQLAAALEPVDAYWQEKAAALSDVPPDATAAQVFANLVRAGTCDSAIIYDGSGHPSYPTDPLAPRGSSEEGQGDWSQARQMEYELADPTAAAALYGEIAEQATGVNVAALALQAQARCLVKAGRKEAALEILAVALADTQYRDARDTHGRFIVPNAQLLAIQLMDDREHPHREGTLEALLDRLNDYGDPVLPSCQRLFLMRHLRGVVSDIPEFPTLAAEELAADYLESGPSPVRPSVLVQAPLPSVWRMASPDKTVVALFSEESFLGQMQSLVQSGVSLPDVDVKLQPPGQEETTSEPFLEISAGEHLPQWQLVLYLEGEDPFAAAAHRQITTYLWTGVLVVVVISIVALLVGRYLLRQVRLTRLKNDFIANVSHELKTPLSSMRVLVDTLLEGNYRDQEQARDYLQLAARENQRLSRLIDNFLTFSRMERNKRAFEFAEVRPSEIVDAAGEVVRGRFESHCCGFDVNVSPDLPDITADQDALVTVLLNLLDNAYKYSEDDRRIVLRAYGANGGVCFEVQDNGIGMSRRAIRKVFDRFYQVDRTLSRSAGGCGLGLSIVKFIVDAHGGSIDVKSQPGKGSTFTVRLPAGGVATADS